jgi:branched-chain amino acid transport system substrate-binding protein
MHMKHVLSAATVAALLSGSALAQGDDPVKIGVLNDRSGIYADLSGEGSVIAARMAVEDVKAADKGMNVEIVAADHQNKPDIASNIARQWIDQEGVDVIVDVPTSSAALAVNEVVREKNKVFLNSGAASSDLTGAQCSPNTVHWTYDTVALANGTGKAMVERGGKTWFFVTADYAFGHALERDTTAVVEAAGGQVLGSVRHPFPGQDFSSFLLQAQSSGADVIALANAGGDTINSIKQAAEFGITQGGQDLAGLLIFITDVNALGLQTAQGLVLTEAFYWDLNDGTREWSKRFAELNNGNMPTMVHAGVYASILHYLKAIEAAGTQDAAAVMAKMKEMPSDDPLFGKGVVRQDGRHIHDMYLVQGKTPDEAQGPWDYYKLLATIPGEEAFRPLEEGGCPFIQASAAEPAAESGAQPAQPEAAQPQ